MWSFMGFTVGVGMLSAAVVVIGSRRLRRPLPKAWIYLALALGLNCSGAIVETLRAEILYKPGWLSPAWIFYFMLYPCLAISVGVIIKQRARRHEATHLIDALIITAGVGLLTWVVLIRAALGDPFASVLERVANAASPIGDLVIIAALARLLLQGGWRILALRLLTLSIVLFLAVDVAWTISNQLDAYYQPGPFVQSVLTLIPLLAYVVAAAAPLHPSAQELGERNDASDRELGPVLLLMLSLACLVAPATLLVEVLRGKVTDGVAIAVCAGALTLLVIARMADLVRRVQAQSLQLKELALEDPLTGLANRRALTARLSAEMALARRRPHQLAVALLDLDLFKNFNDTHGHSAGDDLLRQASAQWQTRLRDTDFLARMGGEEFLVLLPGADLGQVEQSIARLQAVMPLGQTFSAGIAFWDGQELSEELIERADVAMYQAKVTGRARFCIADSVGPTWPVQQRRHPRYQRNELPTL
jgi:diguanylate cyclase (GGDEF)-like protein